MATIAELEAEVSIAEITLQFLLDEIDPLTDATTNESQMTRLRDDLEAVNGKFSGALSKLFALSTTAAEITSYKSTLFPLMRKASLAMDKANEYIRKQTTTHPPPKINPVKLEPLKVPTFSGNHEDWPTFRDLFRSSIHDRTDIQGATKLTYLHMALTGKASAIIASYEHTDLNYQEAWDELNLRYNITREIVFAHIYALIDFKPQSSEVDMGLASIVNAIKKCIRALTTQKVPVEHWDLIIIAHGLRKLDAESRHQWTMHFKGNLPTVTEFTDFLVLRSQALSTSCPTASASKPKPGNSRSAHHVSKRQGSTPAQVKCVKCSGEHYLSKCTDYKTLSIEDRWKYVKQKKLCFWCLAPNHNVESCHYKRTCNKCGEKHHYTLHRNSSPAQAPVSSSRCAVIKPSEQVILMGTLLVDVKDASGLAQQCRVFVDNGSETHFISQHCLDRLGLKTQKVNIPLNVVGHQSGPVSKAQVSLTMSSQSEAYSLDIDALVLPKFTGLIPAAKCQSKWSHLEKITLSDPQFFKPHYTDILLGAAKTGHILLPGIIRHPTNPNAPVAICTRFGWMLNGEAPASRVTRPARSIHHVTMARDQNLDEILEKFWEQEEPETHPRPQSSSDVECERHFLSTHTLNPDGTYTVRLPFRPDHPELGKSRETAIRRFKSVEARLATQPEIKMDYYKSIRDYISLGYLQPIPPEEPTKPCSSCYYLPHHAVVKESSSTTKVRVVYDASAKTSTGISLNDILYTGPKLQVDLNPLLIRFMSYPIAMSADIWKFYPQTSVHEDHRDFQRLVWREDTDQPIQDYRMNRVMFGVSPAPFLAIRAFHELANRVKLTHPHASQVIKEEFLVDNLLTGGNSVKATKELTAELLEAMKIGGLKLLKFMSNSEELLQSIPPDLRDPAATLQIDDGEFVRTIGILWNPTLDVFSVKIQVPQAPLISTKRTVLSMLARTFDPLGWLSPVTITPKILVQDLWKAGLTWDEPLPLHFHQQWRKYCEELPVLQEFSLPRNAFAPPHPSSTGLTHQLHGFSDGSDLAHAACVYVRTEDSQGRASVKLLTAKTKVNPIKRTTTPRSELCGALLLSNLISTTLKALKVTFTSVHCWTDSNVVLGRISPEKKLPIFELNRIRKILDITPPHYWNHVRGDENPADAPSRGISPHQLLNHPLWLNGPPWLMDFVPPVQPLSVSVAAVQPTPVTDFLLTCSSFEKMKRRVAYILRFLHNLRANQAEKRTGLLTPAELQLGLNAILKIVQQDAFSAEIENCSRGTNVKTRLKFLTPFLDDNGVLRVGGRLGHSGLPYSHKHPALIPKNHHVVDAIARDCHNINLHAGPTLLLSILREQFWPISGLHLVKRTVRKCVTCHRHQAVTTTQLMGQLPPARVNQAHAFEKTGVDYAGPFSMSLRTGRKPTIIKAYVALFVCMSTKASHLELVSDLTSAAFIAALQRFISRRGLPSDIYSDEGTNFVGAKKELAELLEFVNSAAHIDAVKGFLSPKGISFHTNPPASPHHGGLWEAAVKSMKFHLRRVMGTRNLTTEEFRTLLCQIEAMLNSRPLTPLSDDPNELGALTPGHFLIGRPLAALPYPDLGHVPVSRLDRWQTIQCLSQNIWASWKRAYLSLLQSRPKWYAPLPDLTPGTLVLLLDKDSSLGPQQWKLGRITEIFPGHDGKTRVCNVRTNVTTKNPHGTILLRPVVKLSPLPIY